MFKAPPALRGRLETAEAQALPGGQTPKTNPECGAGRGALIAQSPLSPRLKKVFHQSCGSSPKQLDSGMEEVNLSPGCKVLSGQLQIFWGWFSVSPVETCEQVT